MPNPVLVGTEAAFFEAEVIMTFSGASINNEQFFLYSFPFPHITPGGHHSERVGTVQVRLGSSDETIFAIAGVSFVPDRPCQLSPGAVGRAITITVEGRLVIRTDAGRDQTVGGWDPDSQNYQLDVEFMGIRWERLPPAIRPIPYSLAQAAALRQFIITDQPAVVQDPESQDEPPVRRSPREDQPGQALAGHRARSPSESATRHREPEVVVPADSPSIQNRSASDGAARAQSPSRLSAAEHAPAETSKSNQPSKSRSTRVSLRKHTASTGASAKRRRLAEGEADQPVSKRRPVGGAGAGLVVSNPINRPHTAARKVAQSDQVQSTRQNVSAGQVIAAVNPPAVLHTDQQPSTSQQRPASADEVSRLASPRTQPKSQSSTARMSSGAPVRPDQSASSVSTVYPRGGHPAVFFNEGSIRLQALQARRPRSDQEDEEDRERIAQQLELDAIVVGDFHLLRDVHLRLGHLPPPGLSVFRGGEYALRVTGSGPNVSDCSTCDEIMPPQIMDVENIPPATEVGEIVNACVLADADRELRAGVFADEATGLLFMRPVSGATEFVRAIEEAYDWFDLRTGAQPARRLLRSSMYTDSMTALADFMDRRGVVMADRDLPAGVRRPYPFIRINGVGAIGLRDFLLDRLRRLWTANFRTSVSFIEETAFVIHAHNVTTYAGLPSASLQFYGLVDDRLLFAYLEAVEVWIAGRWAAAHFVGWTQLRFSYLVWIGTGVTEVRQIRRTSPLPRK